MKILSFICAFAVSLNIFCITASAEPSVSAKAAAVINGKTGTVIYSKNADTRLAMASTTKIMTALLLCEAGELDKELTVTDKMVRVEGTSMGLTVGITVTRRDLLYGMLLSSGNDAANAAAVSVAGSVPAFIALMNRRAEELGLENTHFETPSGLDGENHYTTAKELALLASAALENNDFKEACSSKSVSLFYGDPPVRRTLTNHNKLLKSYDGLIGVKTGFTKKAGRCLVTAAERDGALVIAVTLNDPNDWDDHRLLLDYGFSALEKVDITECCEKVKVPVAGTENSVVILKSNSMYVWLTEKEKKKLSVINFAPEFLYSPVEFGQSVGQTDYYVNGKKIATTELFVSGKAVYEYSDINFARRLKNSLMLLIKGL